MRKGEVAAKAALMIGSLAAYWFVGSWLRGDFVETPEIYKVAKCQRAVIDARKGHPDPQLLEECRSKGLIPTGRDSQGN
ncbi:hypothetical protein [Mesorhizobium sp. WSM3626]|uniref:hypothetical protein n=1 Tax=Mesorhizobium sp. WSM3626 TaxID=1040987 RepID=UPI000482A0BF|nr:hypothetical protein [Mesorhizobium sp. WSM3626]